MTEQKEVVMRESMPLTLLNIAIEKGADIEKLEKLMNLHLTWEKEQAKKAYWEAMTAFKANPPEIDKDRNVKYKTDKGITEYNHASLGNVTEKINMELSKHGLSASWITKQEADKVSVTCRIAHISGHFEETSLTAAPDNSGGKNNIQALGSTITYLERYTILALTGLATYEDDDGKGSETAYIDDKQKSTIVDMINSKEIDEAKFLKYMIAESVDKIPASDYEKAMASLRAAKGGKK
jgi:hypothetical protein